MNFGEILAFRKMITPMIIQIVFLVGVAANAIGSLLVLIGGITSGHVIGIIGGLVWAVIQFVLGTILIRVYCELLILLFRIYDELKSIRTGTPPEGVQIGFPITPTPASPASPAV